MTDKREAAAPEVGPSDWADLFLEWKRIGNMDRLLASLEEAPIVDRDGYDYLVHPISNCVPVLDPALLREVVVGIVQCADVDVDKIVTPEAMGIHISTAVSLFADLPLVVVRKRAYGLPGEVAIHQQTGYAESEMYLNDIDASDRVLVLDDLLSTGNTLHAITAAVEDIGATIADVVVVIRKVGSESAMADNRHTVKSLIDIEITDGTVTVVRTNNGAGY